MTLLVFYLFLAVGISFICSILEAVVLSTNKFYISAQIEKNVLGAKLLKKNSDEIDKTLSAILTLNTFAHTLGAAGVGAQAVIVFGDDYMFLISFLLTLTILYFSEIIPKTIGAIYWQRLAISSAYIIRALIIVTYPLLRVSSFLTLLLKSNYSEKISVDEIKAVTNQGEKDGLINEREGDIIDNILDLKSYKIKDILTPRSVVFALSSDLTIEDFFKIEDYDNFSRIPVYEGSIDNIIGVVLLRTIMIEKIAPNNKKIIKDITNDIYAVNENIHVSKVLELFIRRKEHIFLVKDSFSQTVGIVTLEDAIETLLGVEIVDEFDNVEDMQAFAKEKN